VRALEACLEQVSFADCQLFTDADIRPRNPEIRVVSIAPLTSSAAYSNFLLTELVEHIETSHCLVAQWDGHILDARHWRPEFLEYDYIGASWPQFDDGHDVGNGGFSLRSHRLLQACREQGFTSCHPEDLAIGRINRNWLERRGMRFAPKDLANAFAVEREGDLHACFGYHGVWNMPDAIGLDAFWRVYCELDHGELVRADFFSIFKSLLRGPWPIWRASRLVFDRTCRWRRRG
jgi:hypothetical protein